MRRPIWNPSIDTAVQAAIGELLAEFAGAQISVRELLDDRGVVSIVVTAGDGRLIVAARHIDLVPVEWPWAFTDGIVGLLPDREIPTVDELIAHLTAVRVAAR